MPAEVRERVATANTRQLDRWLARVVLAPTLTDVFGRRQLARPSR